MRRTFSVDKLLSRYFEPLEILRFRELQYQTGTLISGSTALQLLERAIYPESDLDLYLEFRYTGEIAAWLLDIGYTYTPQPVLEWEDIPTLDEAFQSSPLNRPHIPANSSAGIIFWPGAPDFESYGRSSAVFNFAKQSPRRKIQLITSFLPPLRTILSFHFSTYVPSNAFDITVDYFVSMCHEYHHSRYRLLALSLDYV